MAAMAQQRGILWQVASTRLPTKWGMFEATGFAVRGEPLFDLRHPEVWVLGRELFNFGREVVSSDLRVKRRLHPAVGH